MLQLLLFILYCIIALFAIIGGTILILYIMTSLSDSRVIRGKRSYSRNKSGPKVIDGNHYDDY